MPTNNTITHNKNYTPPPPAPLVIDVREQLKIKTWQNARQVIKDEFAANPQPGGMRHAFLANVAMMLYDKYKIDIATANQIADDVIKLCFEDTYY